MLLMPVMAAGFEVMTNRPPSIVNLLPWQNSGRS
jgi:hypothetical protein